MKRPFQPSNIVRKRRHAASDQECQPRVAKVIIRRRQKGRKILSA